MTMGVDRQAGGTGYYQPMNDARVDAGMAPLAQSQVKPPPKPAAAAPQGFQFPFQGQFDQAQGFINSAQNRQAPQAAGVTLGPLQQTANVSLAPMGQMSAPQMGAAHTFEAPKLGPVALGQAGSAHGAAAKAGIVGPQQMAADSAVRQDMMNALNYQGGLMRGENSVAALQIARQRDQALANQRSMAAAARPGQAAFAQLLSSQNSGRIGAEMASREAEATLAERNAAAQAYAQQAGQLRGQDLNLSQFNADQTNQGTRLQAGLDTNASIASAANSTQASIASGQMKTQASLANAGMTNDQNKYQAGLTQQAGLANMDAMNTRDFQNANFQYGADQFNVGERNRGALTEAGINANIGMSNTAQANDYSKFGAQLGQQNQQFNVESQLRQMGLNDAQIANMMNQQLGIGQLAQQGQLAREGMANSLLMQQRGFQHDLDMNKQNQPAWWERALGAVTGLAGVAAPIIGGALGGPVGAAVGGVAGQGLKSLVGGGYEGGISNPYTPVTSWYNDVSGAVGNAGQGLSNFWNGGQ